MGVFSSVARVHGDSEARDAVLGALRTWASQLTTLARAQGVDQGVPAPSSGPFSDPAVINAWESAYDRAALRAGIIQTASWGDRTPRLAPSPTWSSLAQLARERHPGAPGVAAYLSVQAPTWEAIADDWRRAVVGAQNLAGASTDPRMAGLLPWLSLASESTRGWWAARLAQGSFTRPPDAVVDPETQAPPGGRPPGSALGPVEIGLGLGLGLLLLKGRRR